MDTSGNTVPAELAIIFLLLALPFMAMLTVASYVLERWISSLIGRGLRRIFRVTRVWPERLEQTHEFRSRGVWLYLSCMFWGTLSSAFPDGSPGNLLLVLVSIGFGILWFGAIVADEFFGRREHDAALRDQLLPDSPYDGPGADLALDNGAGRPRLGPAQRFPRS